MWHESFHVSDQDLLLWADGEMAPQRMAEIRQHLAACWTCRGRMAELERAIGDFVQVYRREFNEVQPIEGPRALLKARMAEQRKETPASVRGKWREACAAGAFVGLVLLSGIVLYQHQGFHGDSLWKTGAIPNVSLTPGATNPVSLQEVCSANFGGNDPVIPDPLKREVLKEYGLKDVASNSYEIDYLVTPQLGGAASIRNLWPEPASHMPWNARVKDALEDRLHDMVCSGQLDLTTAQREISTDWVAAYKKYFRTNAPLREHYGAHAFTIIPS